MPGAHRVRLRSGDVVQIERDGLAPRPESPAPVPAVLHESASVLVIAKPAGVVTVPDRSGREAGVYALLPELGADVRIVHRLDRDTSGCLLLGKGLTAAQHFDVQFRTGAVHKTYVALVDGLPLQDAFSIDAWLGSDRRRPGKVVTASAPGRGLREAHTDVLVRRRFRQHALLELRPRTGRSHQLRAHLASVGHAIVGDLDYGGRDLLLSALKGDYKLRRGVAERPLLRRMFLHAERIVFDDVDGARVDVSAPLPADLTIAVQKLESYDRRRR
jgi:RluA family pseudouridine synthase